MPLQLYNTLTRKKEAFQPIDPANVRIYVCGPTVYDYAHIGNARPIIVFDVLFRLLRHLYGEQHVTYARNITDVDDKINARAARDYPSLALNDAIAKVTAETTAQFHKDIAALGVLEPTVEPRATGHIPEMVAMCEALVAKGHAYVAEGHVLFDVASMPDYGRLSNRSLEEMEAGARVEVAPYKKGPMDFVLWKPSKEGEPGWPSPCGIQVKGRPGWHIECSAMSRKHLGETFDIHGGGIDLAFPHHENEIAQSRCAHGTPVMANVWMHNGFLQVEGEKMSKSLGNFITIHELLETNRFGGRRWPGEVLRLAMLMTHYRQPINWTADRLDTATDSLVEFSSAVAHFHVGGLQAAQNHLIANGLNGKASRELVESLSDDLNTPQAISVLQARHKVAARLADHDNAMLASAQLLIDCALMGFDLLKAAREFEAASRQLSPHTRLALANSFSGMSLDQIITARLEARKAKNWAESDRIRDELAAMGIQLKDSKNPQTGEIETTWEAKR